MTATLHVALAERGYDIAIGERLLSRAGEMIAPVIRGKRVIIVSDEQVARLYLHRLTNALDAAGIAARPVILPPGEQTKSFSSFAALTETILEQNPDRNTALIALGGGVIGDITGFAASVVLRGIDFVQIPTTLLAQVDSSVGGKTAINSRFGKNLVGSFYQPKLVIADTSTLTTLPKRELLAGYAEVVKYGLVNDAVFFTWCEENAQKLIDGDAGARAYAIEKSCAAKAAIVSADEREGGVRALLNLGHTFAHAFEAETGYGDALLHGEAVGLGMALAFEFSATQGLCPPEDAARVRAHLAGVGLPVSPRDLGKKFQTEALMQHFTRDKKAKDGALTFILARGIGKSFVAHDVDATAVKHFLEERL